MRIFVASSGDRLDAAKLLARDLPDEIRRSAGDEFVTEVTVWDNDRAFRPGSTTIRSLEQILDSYDAGIFFVDARSKATDLSDGDQSRIASTNVIFELGFMAGAWGRERTLIVHRRSHAPDKFGDIDGVTKFAYERSITECVPQMAQTLHRLGPRPDDRRDIGVLVRMLNVCTYQPSSLRVAATKYVNHRGEEGIQQASDLVEYVVDTMSDFVTPRIPALAGLRVYFATYLGDGVSPGDGNTRFDHVDDGHGTGEMKFVIGFSNEDEGSRRPRPVHTPAFVEQHWFLGQPISESRSNTATVFKRQKLRQAMRGQDDYQRAKDEIGVVTIPVVWQGWSGVRVSLGALAISVRDIGGISRPAVTDLRERLEILALAIASAFDLIVRTAEDDDYALNADGNGSAGSDPCDLFGVTCDGDGDQTELRLALAGRRAFGTAVVDRLIRYDKLQIKSDKLVQVDAGAPS